MHFCLDLCDNLEQEFDEHWGRQVLQVYRIE